MKEQINKRGGQTTRTYNACQLTKA